MLAAASARLVGLVAVAALSAGCTVGPNYAAAAAADARSSSASSKARRRSRWPTRPWFRCSRTRRCRR